MESRYMWRTQSTSLSWLPQTRTALEEVLVDFIGRKLPHRRIGKLAGLLLLSGSLRDKRPEWAPRVVDFLIGKKQPDGGWVDCEDTSWCAFVLETFQHRKKVEDVFRWLQNERSGDAWGYCRRDMPCIPITSTVGLLLPHLWDSRSERWLCSAWSQDLQSPVRLSYKAAWYLLADRSIEGEAIRENTKKHLLSDQRNDGGWGPWCEHPASTDCFSTGIAMWALALQKREDQTTAALNKALKWCGQQCLPNGLFPTHFIEEGSAWIYVGCMQALNYLGIKSSSGD
jgi:hypothetical protein